MWYKINSRKKILLAGFTFATIFLVLRLLFVHNPTPCPRNVTQQQVEATGCSVGAVIFDAFLSTLFLTFAIIGITIFIAMAYTKKPHAKSHHI